MSEWWTYRPGDFVMFSADIYWRLFADLNRSWWPVQPLLSGAGVLWLLDCMRRAGQCASGRVRIAAALLAVAWGVVAWFFLWQRFAPINWIAGHAALLFAVEAAMLAWLALRSSGWRIAEGSRRWMGIALGLWALLGLPALGVIVGRPWIEAEFFGIAPDPTAIGTLALLLLAETNSPAQRRLTRLLWPIPLSWCVASAALSLALA